MDKLINDTFILVISKRKYGPDKKNPNSKLSVCEN